MQESKTKLSLPAYILVALTLSLSVAKSFDVWDGPDKQHQKCTPWYSLFFLMFTVYSRAVEIELAQRRRMRIQGLFLAVISWIDVVNTWHATGASWTYWANRTAAMVAHTSSMGVAMHNFLETGWAW